MQFRPQMVLQVRRDLMCQFLAQLDRMLAALALEPLKVAHGQSELGERDIVLSVSAVAPVPARHVSTQASEHDPGFLPAHIADSAEPRGFPVAAAAHRAAAG